MTRMDIKNAAVVGAGRWGTAMALYLHQIGVKSALLARDGQKATEIRTNNCSPRLTKYKLPENLTVSAFTDYDFSTCDALFISTPVVYLRQTLPILKNIPAHTPIIGINKGIERDTFLVPPQITAEFFPKNPYMQLGGPCFPEGLLDAGKPAAETLACQDSTLGKSFQRQLSSAFFRLYFTHDVMGVAYMGALKNIYAVAAGFIEGLNLNEEASAIMITRALAEMRRFCREMNISEEALYGLSGLGDLVLTCYSKVSSHNKSFGREFIGSGGLDATAAKMGGAVAEGVYTAKALYDFIRSKKTDMPLVSMVYQVLYENRPIQQAIAELMSRPLKTED